MTDTGSGLLREFLDGPERPDGTLRLHELQGFLFAIASSPETIPPSEWLPIIGDDQDLNFADEDEAQETLGLLMALYNEVNIAVLERSNALPSGCAFEGDIFANFEDDSSVSQWSGGLAAGHDWLSDVWEEYLPDEMDDECGATLMVLSFFSSRQLAEAYFKDSNPHRAGLETAFEDFAERIRELFPAALASYAHIGRTIYEFLLESSDSDAPRH